MKSNKLIGSVVAVFSLLAYYFGIFGEMVDFLLGLSTALGLAIFIGIIPIRKKDS